MKSILIVAVLAFSMMLQACGTEDSATAENSSRQAMATVSASDAAAWQASKEAVIIDVREQDEWDAGHIEGAVFIPLGQLPARLAELRMYDDQKIVLQCRSGKRSAAATKILMKAGFDDTYNLSGGIKGWVASSLPTVK